jgi:hypothetical protein
MKEEYTKLHHVTDELHTKLQIFTDELPRVTRELPNKYRGINISIHRLAVPLM